MQHDKPARRTTQRDGDVEAQEIRSGRVRPGARLPRRRHSPTGYRAPAANLGGPELNNMLRDTLVISVKTSVSRRAPARRNVASAACRPGCAHANAHVRRVRVHP